MRENELITIPLGLCLWTQPVTNAARTTEHAAYVREILDHAGVCYRTITPEALPEALPNLRILLTIGETSADSALQESLRNWVAQGGMWVSVGGVCGLSDLFGVQVEPPAGVGWAISVGTLGEGYMQACQPVSPLLSHTRIPLHFFNGIPVRATDAEVLAEVLDAHQRPTPLAALTQNTVGKGHCLLIAPDLTGTVVRIQQGIGIACDGVPSPDGTAPTCDQVLKSDDGCVLDWLLDRVPVEGIEGLKGFVEPIADQWRELLLRALFTLAEEQQIALPLLWFYPRNLPALAHISHDSDGNDVQAAQLLLDTLQAAHINTTWCVLPPGYPPEIIASIREAGHELAMHYDSLEAPWSEEEFESQWRFLTEMFGGTPPVTNKNHYLRWEGYTEFYDWCAKRGIELDQSKGASKMGEVGYNFGTCHLYFPEDRSGQPLDVLELPTPTQDLGVFVPPIAISTLLESVLRHNGVLHLLFHPGHTGKEIVNAALREAVTLACREGLEWWTGEQLNRWERARRQAQWSDYLQAGACTAISLTADALLPDATLMWLASSASRLSINGECVTCQEVTRWGFRFQVAICDVAPGTTVRIELER